MNSRLVAEGRNPLHTHRQLSHALNKWKRSAYHRIRQTRQLAIARRAKVCSSSFKLPSMKSIYKSFIRGTHTFSFTKAFNPDKPTSYTRPKKKHDENYRIKRQIQRTRHREDRKEILRQQRGEELSSSLAVSHQPGLAVMTYSTASTASLRRFLGRQSLSRPIAASVLSIF